MSPKESMPQPTGPFQVGYQDIMTIGEPETSCFHRLYYPAPTHTKITSPPLWADRTLRHDLIGFIRSMAYNWPSWVNNSEYLLLPPVTKILNQRAFTNVFNLGWKSLGKSLTIPICHGAPLEEPPNEHGWPVVVFSHGMGCNRFVMSQLCYQLASHGVVVAAVEHRDGSGCGSHYVKMDENGKQVRYPVPHLVVANDESEYDSRHQQIIHRVGEIQRVIDLLAKINAGEIVENLVTDDLSHEMGLSSIKSCLDLQNNLFLIGHSFGGSSIMLVEDPRVKNVLALDPWMFPVSRYNFELSRPIVVVNTEKFLNENNLKVVRRASTSNENVQFRVTKNGVHLSPTDVPSVFPKEILFSLLAKGMGFMDKMDSALVTIETNALILDWFRKCYC